MKYTAFVILFFCILAGKAQSQVFISTEYFGSSSFRDQDNNKVGDSKGRAVVYEGAAAIPFSVKMNEHNRPTMWGMSLYGSYTRFNNHHMTREMTPDEILNLNISFMHIRPISEKYSIMAAVGVGAYTSHTDFSQIGMRQILGNIGGVFIWHIRDNMDLGGGLALNNSFGYPMVFPAAVFQWRLDGKYEVNVQMINAVEVSAGIHLNRYLKLLLFANMNASMTLEKTDGKNMVFTHQYVNTGIQPVFKLGKGFSVPVTIGVTPYRAAFYTERTLKAFFSDSGGDHDPHFAASFYGSVSLRYGF